MIESSVVTVGTLAPEFSLKAANRFTSRKTPQTFSLVTQVAQGPVILEFLRGTW